MVSAPSPARGLAPVVRSVLRRELPWLAAAFAISLLAGLAGLVQPALIRDLLVDLVGGGGVDRLSRLALAILGLQCVGFALHGTNTWVAQRIAFRIQRSLRDRTFQQLLDLPLGFFRTMKKGEVLSQVTRDLANLEHFLASAVPEFVFRIFLVVAVFSWLVWLAPAMALASLVVLPPLALLVRSMFRRLAPYANRVRSSLSEINSFYEENVSGVDLIKAYGQEGPRRDRFERASRDFYEQSMKGARIFAVFPTLQSALMAAGTIGLVMFGLWRVEGGAMDRETMLLAFLYLGTLYGGFQSIAGAASRWPDVKVSWHRLRDLYDRDTERTRTGSLRPASFEPRIAFEAVDFAYEGGSPVLSAATFEILPGERVALVGPSGIGKSTIANLVLGFYAPKGGRILLGGLDAAELDLDWLRSRIAYVDQENFLFDASLEENVRLGRADASAEEVARAIRIARLDEFVGGLPEGLATRVGTRGTRLSMGQRQRVAIARAVLRDAPILVLDEYTSNVDPATEAEIRAGLVELARDRTTLVITHRPSTLLDVDRILRLDGEGRVVPVSGPAAAFRPESSRRAQVTNSTVSM